MYVQIGIVIAIICCFGWLIMTMTVTCTSCHKLKWPWNLISHSESGGVSCNTCYDCWNRLYGRHYGYIDKKVNRIEMDKFDIMEQ